MKKIRLVFWQMAILAGVLALFSPHCGAPDLKDDRWKGRVTFRFEDTDHVWENNAMVRMRTNAGERSIKIDAMRSVYNALQLEGSGPENESLSDHLFTCRLTLDGINYFTETKSAFLNFTEASAAAVYAAFSVSVSNVTNIAPRLIENGTINIYKP